MINGQIIYVHQMVNELLYQWSRTDCPAKLRNASSARLETIAILGICVYVYQGRHLDSFACTLLGYCAMLTALSYLRFKYRFLVLRSV